MCWIIILGSETLIHNWNSKPSAVKDNCCVIWKPKTKTATWLPYWILDRIQKQSLAKVLWCSVNVPNFLRISLSIPKRMYVNQNVIDTHTYATTVMVSHLTNWPSVINQKNFYLNIDWRWAIRLVWTHWGKEDAVNAMFQPHTVGTLLLWGILIVVSGIELIVCVQALLNMSLLKIHSL